MADGNGAQLLEVVLDAWDRNQQILLNLLRAVPEGGLAARALAGSPTVAEMFTHLHHERMVSVLEEAPECAGTVPQREWLDERDAARIEAMLVESARRVREAVQGRVEAGRQTELDYDHPLLLLQLLLFHDAYHHGQIKLALKAAGLALDDQFAGPLTWGVWRRRR
ncbi:MAG: damage-inducible protein DinB [Bryobacterales bacterium]|nr:damage-inducible protein DinB [Bryobacterales bacterium]